MKIFAHVKNIAIRRTEETIHNKSFLLIMNQFQCYYHQCDHYSQRWIERVVMNFFKKLFYTCMKATTFFLFLHIESSFFICRDAICKDSKHAVLVYCAQASWWFLLCIWLSLSSRSLAVCVTTIIIHRM